MNRGRRIAATAVAALMLLIATACGTDKPATTTGAPAGAGVTEIAMKDITFSPAETTIKVNETVRWVNDDPVAHTVSDDSGLFDSGPLEEGASFEQGYDRPGTYSYHCKIHPATMKGTVIVEE